MSEKLWQDEDIEQLLKQLPNVEDTRSKEDVFARLQQAGAFEEEVKEKLQKGKRKSYAPIYITAAVVALLAIVPIAILNNNNQQEDVTMEQASLDMATEESVTEMSIMQDSMDTRTLTTFTIQDRFAVYEEELVGYRAIPVTKHLATMNIPMTLLVQDETGQQPTLTNEQQQRMNELELQEVSTPSEFAYALIYEEGIRYFAPLQQQFDTVEQALLAMRNVQNPFVSAIAEGVRYKIRTEGEIVFVQFIEPFDLDTLATVDAMYMVEAMNLTAASFKMRIQLENVVQTSWQNIDFTHPLPAIVGPNKLYLE